MSELDDFFLKGEKNPVLERLHTALPTGSTPRHLSQKTLDFTHNKDVENLSKTLQGKGKKNSPELKHRHDVNVTMTNRDSCSLPFMSAQYSQNENMLSSYGYKSQHQGSDCDCKSVCGALPKSHSEAEWFMHPVHIEKGDPIMGKCDVMHSKTINNLEYFPSTQGTISSVHTLEQQSSSLIVPYKSVTVAALLQHDKSRYNTGFNQSKSNHLNFWGKNNYFGKKQDWKEQSPSGFSKRDIVATETHEKDASPMLLSSPFQHELAQLQMERLRLEEKHLLEIKRLSELERIRGPRPKWYELKSRDFHYEAHKNNEILGHQDQWQNLLDYRSDLLNAHEPHLCLTVGPRN